MVHGAEEYEKAVEASGILFGNATSDALKRLDEQTLLSVFEGVPQFEISKDKLGNNILELLAVDTNVFPSKGEARKMIQANGVSVNKEKFTDPNGVIDSSFLVNGKYVLVQKGKKNYYLLKFV